MRSEEHDMRSEPDKALLAALETEYNNTGNGEWLLLAVTSCIANQWAAPVWVRSAWAESVTRWTTMESRTIGEALVIAERPKNRRSREKQRRYDHLGNLIYERVQELREIGDPVDDYMFERIAEEFSEVLASFNEDQAEMAKSEEVTSPRTELAPYKKTSFKKTTAKDIYYAKAAFLESVKGITSGN